MYFHERLRELRELKGLNQTQLGKLLNMSQKKISRLETGQTEPTTKEIIEICKFFKVSADYILGLSDKER